MIYGGTVRNGVVVFETETAPPKGTPVQVVSASDAPTVSDAELDPFFRMDELAVETGIPDLARNHDHYLYEHPGLKEMA